MTSADPGDHRDHSHHGDPGEVLDAGPAPRWGRWWSSLPARRRKAVSVATAVLLVVAPAAAGAARLSDWLDERERRRAVSLTVSLGVWASSSSPPGGQVTYYLSIRNGGAAALEVTSVLARNDRLVLRARDDAARRVAAGREILVPVSALLTCSSPLAAPGDAMELQVDVRRTDGSTARRLPALRGASPVLTAADTLCEVRPELVGYELSGPVLRPAATVGGEG